MRKRLDLWLLLAIAFIPAIDLILPFGLTDPFRSIIVFAIAGLGLSVITGFTGLLHLGAAGFMAIGSFTYAILTCDIYPFQVGFWLASILAACAGAICGALVTIPLLRLRGDYLAIVTLGFGEIIQDLLRNLEVITKGTQGINPLPGPTIFGYSLSASFHYTYLLIMVAVIIAVRNLFNSHIGRAWLAIREDELAAARMGVKTPKMKLWALVLGSGLIALSGAMFAAMLGSSGEPGNFDFQISIMILCVVIVGGLGSISGAILGAILMIGFNSIVLVKLAEFLGNSGLLSSDNVLSSPGNWKFLIYGLALVLVARFRPQGLISNGGR